MLLPARLETGASIVATSAQEVQTLPRTSLSPCCLGRTMRLMDVVTLTQCKTDSGPDARGLKQPPNQPEVRVDFRCISNMDKHELMLHACLRAEQLLQNLAAVSGQPGLDAITEDQLIQASAMYHCSIAQELKGGLITDRAARKVAVQLRFSIPCATGDTQASCRLNASEIWSPSNFSPPGPRPSRPLVHRGTCLPASGPRPGTLAVADPQPRQDHVLPCLRQSLH